MAKTALDVYCDAFAARRRHDLVNASGARGAAFVRLLVTDDAGYDPFVAEVASAQRGVVNVFEQALRCDEFMRSQAGWSADRPAVAMILRDLEAVPAASLPDGLELRPVNRIASEWPDGVPLREALAVAITSDPGITASADAVAGYLGGLPSAVRLFAAVDAEGVAHATSACHVFGEYAQVFFVNTEPTRRRRGIGRAMTVEALRAAGRSGARRAVLNATDDGAPLYEGVGFEPAGRISRFSRDE